MHPYAAALGITLLLVLAGTGLSLVAHADEVDAAADHADHAEPLARMKGHGAGAHAWEGGRGVVPTLADSVLKLERRGDIVIHGDDGFNPANGVRSGTGTFEDPFVISGWSVDTVYIRDTSKAFELKENYVTGIMVLDWTAQGGYVHHNHIANLRTNRNVERTGDPTAAVIEKNEILRVEELRHFDGVLRNNTIGSAGLLPTLGPRVALNIAGLNGAGIHDNVIHGGVDMKLHGHHHSDQPGAHSHNHGQADVAQQEDHVEDHQVRHIDFLFYNNVIRDDQFGLRYNDLNHAGDDRQATSEQEPELEKPHVHHTRIAIVHNTIEGATLRIVAVNARDERHLPGETAELVIADNRIVRPMTGDGLVIQDVANATVTVRGNSVEEPQVRTSSASAILLQRVANSTISVAGNAFGDYAYGVRARQLDELTHWTVDANRAPGVKHPVYWDESVANPPGGAEAAEEHEHEEAGHGHGEAAAPSLFGALRRR